MDFLKRIPLYWQIIVGMILGVVAGLVLSQTGLTQFTQDWISPVGVIFIRLLKLIAVPLVLASLIKGVTGLSDISKLSRMGGKTVGIYLVTTLVAVSIGLFLVNVFEPGKAFSEEKRQEFSEMYASKSDEKKKSAESVKQSGPLQPVVDMVSGNIFESVSDNGKMLQVIVFAVLFGIGLVLIDPKKAQPVKDFFEGVNDVIIKIVELIMYLAPLGVFALLAGLITDFAGDDLGAAMELFGVLGFYTLVVFLGLLILGFGFYPLMLKTFAGYSYRRFLNGISPAQMLAFSTSSSAATLPVTMDRVQNHLGVSKEVTSFVLPMGATINMDGTSLYQAVAAVFIAQAFGMELGMEAQLSIVLTATLASVGAAAVPGAGLVMLVIVLEQAKIPVEGLTLIFAMDRILDMCRTVVNVTGDASVSVLIAKSENQLFTDETPKA